MSDRFILAIDQGTSATKCVLIDRHGHITDKGSAPLSESYPAPGWVEQDPEAIWRSVHVATRMALKDRDPACVEAVAFSTQRESMLLWDRATGAPISPLVSWQDRRTADACEALRADGHAAFVRERSGLPLDPMFSALKAKWLLDHYDPDRDRAHRGELCLGTVDAFFLRRLGGPAGENIMEAGNASRTQLLNVRAGTWDADLLALFNIPEAALPRVVKSVGPFPAVRGLAPLVDGTPVLAVLGDSHAALFGHGAFRPGQFKATYGTGSSVMGLVDAAGGLHPGICLTMGWEIEKPALAAEANIRSSGATLRWLANLFGAQTTELAAEAERFALGGGRGAIIIPGFNGLGAPWWDNHASGTVAGLTLDSRRESLSLGAIESIAQQVADVLALLRDGGVRVERLHADGGPTRNAFLMQTQADLAGVPVICPEDAELSALGAAHLAGIGAGWWTWADLEKSERPHRVFTPGADAEKYAERRAAWKAVLARATHGSAG